MRNIKKVAAIQDMSGLGRCSLTVIIPVLSAMGIQVCPVPTAVLSAHTGYGEFVMHDLTDFMVPVLEHYKKLKVDFDCIYSGFLASAEQIDHCLEFFRAFPDSLKLVDPVMGDDGRAYATYTKELCDRMSELVAVADGLFGPQDGGELRHLQMADAGQLVIHLALLGGELDVVGEGLPAAAAAHPEMLAERLQAMLGRLYDLDDRALQPGFLLAHEPHVHHVARHGEAHEHHLPFGRVGDGLALRRHRFDDEVFQYDVQFAVSWHRR